MPRHDETRSLPYSASQMFDLVADVDRYPEFLPWIVGVRIRERNERMLTADLMVGFRVFRERFTSRVTLERPRHIQVDYLDGPLKYLHNDWRFEDEGEGRSRISFRVDFEFRSRLFESLAGGMFTHAVHRMVQAFEKRAAALYAPAAASASSDSPNLTVSSRT